LTPDEFRDARRRLGQNLGRSDLSQNELARALGLSSGDRLIRHYENGTRPVGGTVQVLIRYFLEFGLPEQALAEERKPPTRKITMKAPNE
jgi:transcriptional regulator with XRE-family HTH domain